VDVTPVDVTPRTLEGEGRPPIRPRRSPAAYLLVGLVVVAIAVVVMQFLNNAALYYRNADEAVRDRAALGTKRFRIQGVVQDGVEKQANEVDFTIEFNGTSVAVRHIGDPPELFKPGVPVVLEGKWQGDYFASDRILIKHSAEYKEQNPDRLSNAPG
jgi:cytochrome c-type biogenesis protein CcmE